MLAYSPGACGDRADRRRAADRDGVRRRPSCYPGPPGHDRRDLWRSGGSSNRETGGERSDRLHRGCSGRPEIPRPFPAPAAHLEPGWFRAIAGRRGAQRGREPGPSRRRDSAGLGGRGRRQRTLAAAGSRELGVDTNGVRLAAGQATAEYVAVLEPDGHLALGLASMEILEALGAESLTKRLPHFSQRPLFLPIAISRVRRWSRSPPRRGGQGSGWPRMPSAARPPPSARP